MLLDVATPGVAAHPAPAMSWPPAHLVIAWLVLGPVVAAAAAVLLGPRGARRLATPVMVSVVAAAVALAGSVLAIGPERVAVAGWGAPLGIELRADGLSVVMVLVTAVVATLVGLYAERSFLAGPADAKAVHARSMDVTKGHADVPEGHADTPDERAGERNANGPGDGHFWPLAWLLWASMNGVYLSDDLFNIYVTLELLGLAAVGLVALAGEAGALAGGIRYLLAALVGSLGYLMGVALLYGAHGTLALNGLGARVADGPAAWVALAMMAFGLILKTALFPLHFWLPSAHGTAPTPVSALLSALVIKASFYLLLRLWFEVFPAVLSVLAAQAVGVLGAAAIVWGSLLALRQQKLKMLVAYSTVAQIGYLFLLFPLATHTPADAAALGWSGGVYHLIAHALAKAGMFLAAGSLVMAMGKDDLRELDRVAPQLPWSLFAFGLAGVSLMGLPPSGGFTAKWLLLASALATGQWWWIIVMIVGGLLTAAYIFRVVRSAFSQRASAAVPSPSLPPRLEITAFALAAGSVLLGMYTTGPLALLRVGAPFQP